MQRLAKAISSVVISYGVAKEEDRELYEYSFQLMLEQVSIGMSILTISLFFGVFFETVLYMVLFIPLRIYAGGYHARTFSWCYIISVGAYLSYVVLLNNVVFLRATTLCLVLASAMVVLLLAPMADPNKQMNIQETTKFKKRVRIILLSQLIIFFMCLYTGSTLIIGFVSFVFIHLALLLIAGKVSFKFNAEHF